MSTATETGHETRDFRLRPIILFAIALALVIGLALFLMWALFDDLRIERQRAEPAPVPIAISELPPEPRLQISPADDMKALRSEEERHLHRYEWINREQGLLRIPIEQAMKRVASEEKRAAEAQGETP